MIITWHGLTCFKIVSSRGKDGGMTAIIDLFGKEKGIRPPKNDGQVLLMTSGEKPDDIGESFLINGAGEYDVKGMYIWGIDSDDKNIIYTIETEDIRICHLGRINQKELTTAQLEEIGDVDILLLPIGGNGSIESKEALKIMEQIEPKITIPMNYDIPNLKDKLEDLSPFLKSLGLKSLPPVEKLSVKKKDLPSEEAKIVVMAP